MGKRMKMAKRNSALVLETIEVDDWGDKSDGLAIDGEVPSRRQVEVRNTDDGHVIEYRIGGQKRELWIGAQTWARLVAVFGAR